MFIWFLYKHQSVRNLSANWCWFCWCLRPKSVFAAVFHSSRIVMTVMWAYGCSTRIHLSFHPSLEGNLKFCMHCKQKSPSFPGGSAASHPCGCSAASVCLTMTYQELKITCSYACFVDGWCSISGDNAGQIKTVCQPYLETQWCGSILQK